MNHKGLLVVISGFSGAGKGTLMKKLLQDYEQYALSISMTTRSPREGEVDGREYFFTTREQFEDKIKQGGFIEYARYCGNYYGTPKDYVEQQMEAGRDVILEIEIQGAMKVKEQFPNAILLFVMPPSIAELHQRLVGRGTETEEVIKARLARAVEESQDVEKYDYMIINDDLEQSMEELNSLINSQHYKINRNLEFVNQIRSELSAFAKGDN